MKHKSLMETNPYLKDPVLREKLIERSVITSSGVEGIKVDFETFSKIIVPKNLPNKDKD